MNETIKVILRNYNIEEFIKTFGSDTSELLELLFERYFNTFCQLKVCHITRYGLLNSHDSTYLKFACYMYSYGKNEHVNIVYNISDYSSLSVWEFLVVVNNQLCDKFIDNRENEVKLVNKTIDEYILSLDEYERKYKGNE